MDIRPEDLPVKVEKPWGYEIWYAWTDQYVGKIIHVNKGQKLSLQYHHHKIIIRVMRFFVKSFLRQKLPNCAHRTGRNCNKVNTWCGFHFSQQCFFAALEAYQTSNLANQGVVGAFHFVIESHSI